MLFPSILDPIGKTEVKVPTLGNIEVEGGRVASLTKRLIARCRKRPRVVLLDEAHNLDLDVGCALLHASQRVRTAAPFLLILAGTPNLGIDWASWMRPLGTGHSVSTSVA